MQNQSVNIGAMGAEKQTKVSPVRAENRFFFGVAITGAVIIFAGFAPSFFLKSVLNAPPPLSPLTFMHGVFFTTWTLLYVLQAGLIDAQRPALHRRIGLVSAAFFGATAMLGVSTALTGARLGHVPPGTVDAHAFLILPLLVLLAATVLVILALWNRTRRDFHKRAMTAAFIMMTAPAVDRLLFMAGIMQMYVTVMFIVIDLMLAAVIVYDLFVARTKRIHAAYLTAIGVFAVVQIGTWWGFTNPAWASFAARITASG